MESRRDFLKKAAVAAAGLTIVPSKTIAGLGHKAPSDTMNIVGIGIGGKGHPNLDRHENREHHRALRYRLEIREELLRGIPGR